MSEPEWLLESSPSGKGMMLCQIHTTVGLCSKGCEALSYYQLGQNFSLSFTVQDEWT